MTDSEQALSFGKAAALYESIRPGYPAEAARWALGPGFAISRGTVIDLGAGTGLLTRILVPMAGCVIPIEPDVPGFEPPERSEFRHDIPMTAERVHALVASRSTYLVAPAEERAEINERIAAVTAQLPETFTMPYVTVC